MQKKHILTAAALLGFLTTGPAFAQQPDYRAPWRGDFWG